MMEVKEGALLGWLKGSTHRPQGEIPGKLQILSRVSNSFLILVCYQYVLQSVNLSSLPENQPQSAPAAAMKLCLQKRSDLFLLALRQLLLQQCCGNPLVPFPWLFCGSSGNSL